MSWLLDNLVIANTVGIVLTIVAVACLYLQRSHKVLLSRPMSDRLTRWIAGLLILFPIGRSTRADEIAEEEARSQDREEGGSLRGSTPQDTEQDIPITEYLVHQWRRREMFADFGVKTHQRYLQEPSIVSAMSAAEREKLFAELKARETPMADLILEVIQATYSGQHPHVTMADVSQAWSYREGMGAYDPWWDAWLWRVTQYVSPEDEPERLRAHFANIEQRARVADALTKATFEVRPTQLNPRAWMSKAGPPREVRLAENVAVEALLRAARQAYAQNLPTTWRRDAVVRLKLAPRSAPATLWRAGKSIALEPGDTFSFGRLDILQSNGAGDVLIRDVKFGSLQLGANQHATVWQLPGLLRAGPAHRMRSLVVAALEENDEQAARDLELALPISHAAIRARLRESPNAAGTPRLRLILALFDETVIENAADEASSDANDRKGIPSAGRSRRGLGMNLR